MEQKKIGIVTIYHKNYNFGAALQAYALQSTIEKLGHTAQIMDIEPVPGEKRNASPNWKDRLVAKVRQKIRAVKYAKEIGLLARRCEKFEQFKKSHIYATDPVLPSKLQVLGDCYDIYIVGSDQVWNPEYWQDAYFLGFVDEGKVKASYAASIGVDDLDGPDAEKLRKGLEDFTYISVREERAREILEESGVKSPVEVLPDPTFLIDSLEWRNISTPLGLPEDYLICCFLGDNGDHREIAKNMAKRMGLSLVMITTSLREMEMNHGIGDMELIEMDPADFLYAIDKASLVLTDSFHVMALSINLNKAFYVLRRDSDLEKRNMNSRIYSLLQQLGLEERLIDKEPTSAEEIAYGAVNEKIDQMRDRAISYIKRMINSQSAGSAQE